jgi:hypothetical protein
MIDPCVQVGILSRVEGRAGDFSPLRCPERCPIVTAAPFPSVPNLVGTQAWAADFCRAYDSFGNRLQQAIPPA